MKYWKQTSPELLTRMYGLPTEIAQSKNHHFYSPNEFEIDRFRLLAFIKPADRDDYLTFRFWSLDDESESLHTQDILLPGYSGFMEFKNNEIEDVIQLLKKHGDMLEDANPNGRSFQVILKEEYTEYAIKTFFQDDDFGLADIEAIESDFDKLLTLGFAPTKDKFYLCIADIEAIESGYDKLLTLSFGSSRMSISTSLRPQNIKSDDEFRMSYSKGDLNLTKRGVEELCQLLTHHF
jgi:hypothetical protein